MLVKDEWRSASMRLGAQSVMILGMLMMLELLVEFWAFPDSVRITTNSILTFVIITVCHFNTL